MIISLFYDKNTRIDEALLRLHWPSKAATLTCFNTPQGPSEKLHNKKKCYIMFSKTFYHPNNPLSLQKIQNLWGFIKAPHTFKINFLNLLEHSSGGLYDWKSVIECFTGPSIMLINLFHDNKKTDLMSLYCGFTDLQKQLLRPAWTPLREPLKSYMIKNKCCIMFSRTFYHPNNPITFFK